MMGIVLCGGKSLRMGTDKGLLKHDSLPWAEISANKLSRLGVDVVLSVNERQYELYSGKFSKFPIIKDDANIGVNGPLKGILSVHLQFPTQDLLVLACDMPSMQEGVLNHLLAESSDKSKEAFVFYEKFAEPLCAIYTARGLSKIYQQYKSGQLKKHSLQYVLENINTLFLPLPMEWKKYFNNYNSTEDLINL